MTLYCTPSFPRTPSSCTMNSSLPSLHTELLATWSSWRQLKQETPITPPMTAVPHNRRTEQVHSHSTTLPPITTFMAPLTPPRSQDWRTSPKSRPRTMDDSYTHPHPPSEQRVVDALPVATTETPHLVDWLDNTLKRPTSFVAEKMCEMICYLWFATSLPAPTAPRHNHSPTYSPRSHPVPTALQLVASPNFVSFMQKVLETTQVGQSVIVLSLHYIYRLKERNSLTTAQSGSEFRIAVAALMMANKFLDDNTYTNKTWSEVSGIGLEEVTSMEREFLMGIDFNLYVDQDTYGSWRDLLKGLVMAKERDRQQWRRSSRVQHRSSTRPSNTSSAAPASRSYSLRYRGPPHRARSTSPGESSRSLTYAFEFTAPSYPSANQSALRPEEYSPSPKPGCKRQATVAFSPILAVSADTRPLKRPTSMSLEIPDCIPGRNSNPGSNSVSPLESLQSLSKMSLGSSPGVSYVPQTNHASPAWSSYTRQAPQTLVAAYRAEKPVEMPSNLYYYSLAGSAMENEESLRRKAKLRCHQPPPPTYTTYYPPQRLMPMNVQSASTSPHELHVNVGLAPPPLPHFHDTAWTRPGNMSGSSAYDYHAPELQQQQQQNHTSLSESPIPTAPFANAGPPGFQFYATPAQISHSPLYAYNWSTRGRRL